MSASIRAARKTGFWPSFGASIAGVRRAPGRWISAPSVIIALAVAAIPVPSLQAQTGQDSAPAETGPAEGQPKAEPKPQGEAGAALTPEARRAPDQDAKAAPSGPVAALISDMGYAQMLPILVEEGIAYGTSLGQGMFPGRDGPSWQAALARIYEPAAIEARFREAFSAALQGRPEVTEAALAFYSSALGQRLVAAELAARRRLLDPEATEAAEVAASRLREERSPKLRLFRALIEAGDLIEQNVTGGLNGAAAFSDGMAASEPAAQRMSKSDRMAEVWGQEADLRASASAWLLTFSTAAYADLSDEDLKAYAEFMASAEGKQTYAALFAGFSAAFDPVMQALGREAGLVLRGRQI